MAYIIDPNSTLIPAPSWYPDYLPKFYRNRAGAIILRPIPLTAKTTFTDDDILDVLIYWQMIVGYNRIDTAGQVDPGNAACVAWQGALSWVRSAFKPDGNGDGGGNFAAIPNQNIDEVLYKQIQARYIVREGVARPWLVEMNKKGKGIDLISIPMSTDIEVVRPVYYPAYLPSLCYSTGQPYEKPAGFLTTKPMIRDYAPTNADIAALMFYTQTECALKNKVYPMNWYFDDISNGSHFTADKISSYNIKGIAWVTQRWYVQSMTMLDPPPIRQASTDLADKIQTIARGLIGKIPVVGTIGTLLAGLSDAITAGDLPPGTESAKTQAAAKALSDSLQAQKAAATTKTVIGAGIFIVIGIILLLVFLKHGKK